MALHSLRRAQAFFLTVALAAGSAGAGEQVEEIRSKEASLQALSSSQAIGTATDRRFGLFTRLFPMSLPEMAAGRQAVQSAKPGLVMEALEWERIQPTASTWDWTSADAVLAALPANIPLAVELFMVPGWANDNRGSYAPPMKLIANEPHALTAAGSTLSNAGVMNLLEVVTSAPTVIYRQGPDYRVDPATGSIRRTLLSSIPDGATVYGKFFLPGYSTSTRVSNYAITLNGTNWVDVTPNWTPEAEDLAGKFAASVLLSSLPMAALGVDYDGRYGDPSTIKWKSGSALPEGSTAYVSYLAVNPAPFADFAKACVQRYGSRIKQWQVWDEPDGMWDVMPNPETYGMLAKACGAAIKSADPSAQVLVAGTAGDGINKDFLIQVLQYVGTNSVDVITFHMFGQSPEVLSRGQSIYEQLTDLDGTLTALGFTQPFWNTSFGWQTGAGELSEQAQAQYLVRAFVQMAAVPRVEGAIWFCLADFGGPGFTFGITAIDFKPKPAYDAFRVMSERLTMLPFERRLDLGSANRVGVAFAAPGRRVTALWLVGPNANVTIPTTFSKVARVSLYGAVTPLRPQNRQVTVTLSEEPFYLVEYAGDFDADGKADLLFRHPSSGEVLLWLMK